MEYLQYINQEKNTCHVHESFKPYYKWNTFNTVTKENAVDASTGNVLNLIINGIPSILE